MNFQRKNGLSADGIAGAKTLAKIEEKVNGTSSSSSSGSSSSSSSSGNAAANSSNGLLKYGVRSDAVRTLQQNLKTLGYYDGSVTGNFGRLTKEARLQLPEGQRPFRRRRCGREDALLHLRQALRKQQLERFEQLRQQRFEQLQ